TVSRLRDERPHLNRLTSAQWTDHAWKLGRSFGFILPHRGDVRSTERTGPQLWQPMIGKSLATTLMVLAGMLVCAGVSAHEQPGSPLDDPYLQTVWTTENGLPQNSVTAIVQSRDGY